MRRLLPLVLAVALAGCGEAASTAGDFEGEKGEVAEVIEELQLAGERREGDRICKELLATDLIEELENGGVACSTELDKALREADDTTLDVTAVEIAGATATATVEGREGTETRSASFELVQERGAWRISALR